MRRILMCAIAGLALSVHGVGAGGTKGAKPQPPAEETCGDFGTAVKFVKTPAEAARLADKEEKLVFVLHVSGDFEDPDFT